jgi:hypothetical protein
VTRQTHDRRAVRRERGARMYPGVLRSACTTFTAVAMFGQAYIRAVLSTPATL